MKANLLTDLSAEPGRAALLLDVDGTLAPIGTRPEDARVPDKTRSLLRELAARYALVACVSGRSSSEARRIVGVEELLYVGTHGLELAPGAAVWRDQIERFAATVDWPPEWIEDKSLSLSLHYRQSDEPAKSRLALERIAESAEEVGLYARFGRMLLEILPPSRPTREPPSARCSTSADWRGRSTPATTRPTSTPSARSTAWSWESASRSRRARRLRL